VFSELEHGTHASVIDCLSAISKFILDIDITDHSSLIEPTLEAFTSGFGQSVENFLLAFIDSF
jgi:hypothetical protein